MADQLLPGIAPVFDNAGGILAGGSVTFYETGTLDLVTIYSDQDGVTPMTNPVALDAAGRAPQVFYTGAVAVKEVIKNAAGVTIDVIDPSPRFSVTASGADGVTFSPIPSNPATNVQDAISNLSASVAAFGDNPIATVGGGTANAISLTTGKSFTSIPTGQRLSFIASLSNTSAMTVAVDGLPAVSIKTIIGAATPANYARAGVLTDMFYDGTQWIATRLVEAISNANGKAYRYPDGLQICTGISSILTSSEASGPIFRSPLETLTYPADFASPPRVTSGCEFASGGAGWEALTGGASATTVSLRIFNPSSSTSTSRVHYTAVGQWY
jgi:hypothetical protein